jgi:ferric-dicitrate binding protein FerR (iron transport regulator)
MYIKNIPWNAVSARLNNEADAGDLKQIQDWLDKSPDNSLILEEIFSTWEVSRNLPEYYTPDMDYNWNKLIEKINRGQDKKIRPAAWIRYIAAASVLVAVFLSGVMLGDRTGQDKAVTFSKIISPKGNKTRVILPDSSTVWLNSGAELWYSTEFTAHHREVWMKGECFFEVEKDPAHPLFVHANKIQLKVFGTAFNVKEDDSRDLTDVTLLNGKVSVMDLHNTPITELVPGQQCIYQNGKGVVRVAENPEALTSWINNILIFNNQPFEEVIRYLNGWYGVDIQLDKTLYYRHNYTFKVKTESLREVLELISIITPLNYTIEGDQIKIKYIAKM